MNENDKGGSSAVYPLVSVLIAAYNVEDSLETCLNSAISQTYRNLEIIVVDDGSQDSTPVLCNRLAECDGRITIVHQVNGGLSSARNAGLSRATGEYVIFIDSDDVMLPDQIERLLDLLIFEGADIAYCDWFINDASQSDGRPTVVETMSPEEFMPLILTDRITSHAWNKLFRRSLWEGVEFPLGRVAQDMAVMHLVFARAARIVHTSERLYLYNAGNPNNTSNTQKRKPASSIDRAYALESRYELARRSYPQVAEEVFDQLASFKVSAYYKALMQGDSNSADLVAWLRSNAKHVKRSGIGRVRRILASLAGTPLEGLAARAVSRVLEMK